MKKVLDAPVLNEYLEKVQNLSELTKENPEAQKELEQYILEQKENTQDTSEQRNFFEGELAFYRGQYEQSLVYYMQAKAIPHFEFFCFRSTAFLSFTRNELDKASVYSTKALNLRPNDSQTLSLISEIEEKKLQVDEAPDEQVEKLENTNQYIAEKLGVDLDTEHALEKCIERFKKRKRELVQGYLEETKRERNIKDHSLYVLNGSQRTKSHSFLSQIVSDEVTKSTGGLYIRWKGVGIVINPGKEFLEHFHEEGLRIHDIDHIIVTMDSPSAYADIQKIYTLNYQLNKINPELHIINYYINHAAYQNLSHLLKPNFKQEKNTVHSLELFIDSPEIEKIALSTGIVLRYFSSASQGNEITSSLGIALELQRQDNTPPIRIGYLSGTEWTPFLSNHVNTCDLLIVGFGCTNSHDYGKLSYNENTLGYYGTYTLLEEIKPKVLLCTEFDGEEGDIRLEVTRKLRKEYLTSNPNTEKIPCIIPADTGLYIDLRTLKIGCSITKTLTEPQEIQITKTKNTYGRLLYLSPESRL